MPWPTLERRILIFNYNVMNNPNAKAIYLN